MQEVNDKMIPIQLNNQGKHTCERCINCGIYYNKMICTLEHDDCSNAISRLSTTGSEPIFGPIECSEFTPISNLTSSKIDISKAYKMILGGNSEFSLYSKESGTVLNYRVIRVNSAGCIRIIAKANNGEDRKEINKFNSGVFVYTVFFRDTNDDGYINIGNMWYNNKNNRFDFQRDGDITYMNNLVTVLNKLKTYKNHNWLRDKLEIYSHCTCGYCGGEIETIKELQTSIHLKCTKLIKVPY